MTTENETEFPRGKWQVVIRVNGVLKWLGYRVAIDEKKAKVERFMEYAEERGTLVSNVKLTSRPLLGGLG